MLVVETNIDEEVTSLNLVVQPQIHKFEDVFLQDLPLRLFPRSD